MAKWSHRMMKDSFLRAFGGNYQAHYPMTASAGKAYALELADKYFPVPESQPAEKIDDKDIKTAGEKLAQAQDVYRQVAKDGPLLAVSGVISLAGAGLLIAGIATTALGPLAIVPMIAFLVLGVIGTASGIGATIGAHREYRQQSALLQAISDALASNDPTESLKEVLAVNAGINLGEKRGGDAEPLDRRSGAIAVRDWYRENHKKQPVLD